MRHSCQSFYQITSSSQNSWHRENAYKHFMKAGDEELLAAVREFNPYDLYSKADKPVDVEAVKCHYQAIIAKYFNEVVEW